jgi:hypothetical protein
MPTKQTFTAGQVLTAAQLNTLQDYVGVVQVKSTTKTDTFTTTSTSFTDVTGLSVSITPTSASNKILVLVNMTASATPGTVALMAVLLRDSTQIAIGDTAGNRTRASGFAQPTNADSVTMVSISFLDSPATTSATTYKMQIRGNSANTVAINRSVGDTDAATFARTISSITVMEVTP